MFEVLNELRNSDLVLSGKNTNDRGTNSGTGGFGKILYNLPVLILLTFFVLLHQFICLDNEICMSASIYMFGFTNICVPYICSLKLVCCLRQIRGHLERKNRDHFHNQRGEGRRS